MTERQAAKVRTAVSSKPAASSPGQPISAMIAASARPSAFVRPVSTADLREIPQIDDETALPDDSQPHEVSELAEWVQATESGQRVNDRSAQSTTGGKGGLERDDASSEGPGSRPQSPSSMPLKQPPARSISMEPMVAPPRSTSLARATSAGFLHVADFHSAQEVANAPAQRPSDKTAPGVLDAVALPKGVATVPDGRLGVVQYAFNGSNQEELHLVPGQTIEILERSGDGWWTGRVIAMPATGVASDTSQLGKVGLFPYNYVSVAPIKESSPQLLDFSNPFDRH